MVLRRTQRFKWKNGEGRLFYGCSRWPKCDAVHGAHPDGRPLGIPADKATKAARVEAHDWFERVQKNREWEKRGSYIWLGRKLGIPEGEIVDNCHIAMFDAETCRKVVEICKQALMRQKPEKEAANV
jgi:ssDNA-binding Zn-finger/Zn-ribbon topoisomerase 1